mgnify:FL=1
MTLTVGQVVEKASNEIGQLVRQPVACVVSCVCLDQGWRVVIETLERKAVPDTSDILAAYLVNLDTQGNLVNFQRLRVRRR